MSLKKKREDIVELSDNWVAVPSKSHSNKIYYFNTVTKRSTWENPFTVSQKKPSSPDISACSSTGKPRKRKVTDDKETNIESQKETDYSRKSVTMQDKIKMKVNEMLKSKKDLDTTMPLKTIPSKCELISNKSSSDNLRIIKNSRPSTYSQKSCYKLEDDKDISLIHKIVKPIKRTVKEPAQIRLLRKKKEFREEAIKRLALSSSSSKLSKTNDHLEWQNSVMKNFDYQNVSTSKKNIECKDKEMLMKGVGDYDKFEKNMDCKGIVDGDNYLYTEEEEMDWETSEEQVMIEHIKAIRKNLTHASELSTDIAVCCNKMNVEDSGGTKLVLVFDTNVFISCLPFIKDIRDKFILGFGLPNIFIPWPVLQELDHLKSSDKRQIQISAMRAIRYINDNFTARHPRISGQSLEEYCSLKKQESLSPDDEILRICLKIMKDDESNVVVLITNDKNLETKALVSNVQAYSKERFLKSKMSQSWRDDNYEANSKELSTKNDLVHCKLKDLLKNSLEQLLETELINAFGKDWQKLVIRKPPWNLMDIVECLIKHWKSVFSFVFQNNLLSVVEDLKQRLVDADNGNLEILRDIIQLSKELLTSMRTVTSDGKHYRKLLEKGIAEIEDLKQCEGTDSQEKTDANRILNNTSLTSEICAPNETRTFTFNPQECRENMKNVFQIIWDRIKNLSWRISEVVASNGIGNIDVINEIKHQFPIAMRTIQELVEIVENILSVKPERVNDGDQLIMHFSRYLVNLDIFQIDAAELNRLAMYIGFFCGDSDGRVILSSFVNDLKQFGMDMMNGMKALGLV